MDFIIHSMEVVMGHNYLENENRYHVKIDITSQFLASLLDLGEVRVDILLLLRKTFKAEYVGNDIDIVSHLELGVGIP